VQDLLIATSNPGKIREYAQLFSSLPVNLLAPEELGLRLSVQENGETYLENALTKAQAYWQASRLWTLADDSGLEVQALSGRPGVHSARYGGPDASYAQRRRLLLDELGSVPWAQRTARFCCIVVLITAAETTYHTEGGCTGVIALKPRGLRGFGYDPIFYVPAHGQTMGQLAPEIKDQISHRGMAARKMAAILRSRLGGNASAKTA
jgi:XTP/dITP diphosphohydrolase